MRPKSAGSGGLKSYRSYGSGTRSGSQSSSGVDEKHLKVVAVKLSAFPLALDMLVFILGTIIDKRKAGRVVEKKFTEIKTTTKRFESSVGASGEWGEELLKLAGFRREGDWVKLAVVDAARLWLVRSFLEEERKSDVYKLAKWQVDFQKEIDLALKEESAEEMAKRKDLALRVPPPPVEGKGGSSRVYVFLGSKIVQRFFHHDDMLAEVIMWVSATYSTTIQEKLLDGTYELLNRTYYPGKILDYKKDMGRTLFDVGLSPSGELRVLPKGMTKAERAMNGIIEEE